MAQPFIGPGIVQPLIVPPGVIPPLPPPAPSAFPQGAPPRGQVPGIQGLPCRDRAQVALLQGNRTGRPPANLYNNVNDILPCHPLAGNCIRHPNVTGHPAGWEICWQCLWELQNNLPGQDDLLRLTIPIIAMGGPGQPRFVQRNHGVLGLLCRVCTTDEVEDYKRNVATGMVPPRSFRNGWADTCECIWTRLLFPPAGAFCTTCRVQELATVVAEARRNARELQRRARRGPGVQGRVTASPQLIAARCAAGKPLGCRCGRDTVAPSPRPRAMHCLACGGVQIDVAQVRWLRRTRQDIQTRTANGTISVLTNLGPNHAQVWQQPPVSRRAVPVNRSNNSRR